jgi:pyruvate formate lyase activating enzyme
VGRRWTVGELMDEVRRDSLAYKVSGGGVTFSGGEPLAQHEFLLACLDACRHEGIHTAVDTCGVASREVALAVSRRADLMLWDVKHLNSRRHKELTGGRLAPILANLEAAAGAGAALRLRAPLIAGVNDDDQEAAALAALAASLPGVEAIDLLPYHGTGAGKRARLGGGTAAEVFSAPPVARIEELARILATTDVPVTVGG